MNTFAERSMYARFIMKPRELGSSPEKLLWPALSSCRLDMELALGNNPDRRAWLIFSSFSLVHLLTSEDSDPFRLV